MSKEEEEKYTALLAEKDATIASVARARSDGGGGYVESIQKQVDDLIVERNASAEKVCFHRK